MGYRRLRFVIEDGGFGWSIDAITNVIRNLVYANPDLSWDKAAGEVFKVVEAIQKDYQKNALFLPDQKCPHCKARLFNFDAKQPGTKEPGFFKRLFR